MNSIDFYYFFQKSTINPEEGSIVCQVIIDGARSVPISTKINTLKKNWNSKDQCFEGKESARKEQLKKLWEKRMESIRDQIQHDKPYEPIDPNEIIKLHRANKKEIINSRKPQEKINATFIDHFRKYIKYKEKLVEKERMKSVTINVLIAKKNRIEEFLRSKNLQSIKTDHFDAQLLLSLKEWLIINDYKDSTIAKYEQIVKSVQVWACTKGLAKQRPLENYKIDTPEINDPISLELEELEKIEKLRLSGTINEDLCRTADIYRFCMETSLSFCDYNGLTNDMMMKTKSGKLMIRRSRDKTDVNQRIPVSEKAQEIIERYGSLEDLPRKSNYHLNTGIRRIAKLCGISKYLTFHTSRKSAANDMLNNKRMREITIQAVMGWKDSRQLKRYARVNDETIEEEFFGE